MNYPNNIENILGIDDIKHQLQNYCNSFGGKAWVNKVSFDTHIGKLKKEHQQYDEFLTYSLLDKAPIIFNQSDISTYLDNVGIENYFLEEEELVKILFTLIKTKEVLQNFDGLNDELPQLTALLTPIQFPKELLRQLSQIFDKDNKIKPNATSTFKKLHQDLNIVQSKIRKSLQGSFKLAQKNGWLAADNIALRSNRLVLPIIPEHKNKIKGYLVDESAKNRILFIEPIEAFELNNHLADIFLSIKLERIKILKSLTCEISFEKKHIILINEILSQLDFIQAKKELFIELDASAPLFSNDGTLVLLNAKNPLLLLRYKKESKNVIPFSLTLNNSNRILVVSGPNAGGKSVLLKSVLALQYLFQCGLPVSIEAGSSFPIFKNIFVDFGDNQSQENDLSSYSSHLQAMKFFMQHSNSNTLFGIDELGSGTDPQLGGAIGQAILENLYQKGSIGIVNSHFSSIKNMASNKTNFLSGSMLFDIKKLQPLYQLQIGNAGSSFAFELAHSLGMNKSFIKRAKELVSHKQLKIEENLAKIEKERAELFIKKVSLDKKLSTYTKLAEEYEELLDEVKTRKNTILKQAKDQASYILENSNREIEKTVKKLMETANEPKSNQKHIQKNKIKKERQRLEKIKEKALSEKNKSIKNFPAAEIQPESNILEHKKAKIGDKVCNKDESIYGELIKIKEKKGVIQSGIISIEIPLKDIYVSSKKVKSHNKGYNVSYVKHIQDNRETFSKTLDIRGERGDAAMSKIVDFIDKAVMLKESNLKIIHGTGTGVLKELVQNYLQSHSSINQIEYEHPDRGGQGATLIKI